MVAPVFGADGTLPLMTSDFSFLDGPFDVQGRRLRDALDPHSGWDDVPATSSARLFLDGAVSIDEMWFPAEKRFGMSLRVFEPQAGTWSVHWLDGTDGVLQPPVTGRWADGSCWFTGPDSYRGESIQASYAWSAVTAADARWEQGFSVDGGSSWQPNWEMRFVRRDEPVQHPRLPRVSGDFDFLQGEWSVHHRRAVDPIGHALGTSAEIAEFDGTHVGSTFFAGGVSVDELTLAEPGHRGLTFRTYQPAADRWSIYWVNSRAGRLEPPVPGRFVDGVGTFEGSEQLQGHHLRVRFVWSDLTPTGARWSQAFSVDGGPWDDNWEMVFSRPQPAAVVVGAVSASSVSGIGVAL